jgi:hypothetical protein
MPGIARIPEFPEISGRMGAVETRRGSDVEETVAELLEQSLLEVREGGR